MPFCRCASEWCTASQQTGNNNKLAKEKWAFYIAQHMLYDAHYTPMTSEIEPAISMALSQYEDNDDGEDGDNDDDGRYGRKNKLKINELAYKRRTFLHETGKIGCSVKLYNRLQYLGIQNLSVRHSEKKQKNKRRNDSNFYQIHNFIRIFLSMHKSAKINSF